MLRTCPASADNKTASGTYLDHLLGPVNLGKAVSNSTPISPKNIRPVNDCKSDTHRKQQQPHIRSYNVYAKPCRSVNDIKVNYAEMANNSSRFLNSNELRYARRTNANAIATKLAKSKLKGTCVNKSKTKLCKDTIKVQDKRSFNQETCKIISKPLNLPCSNKSETSINTISSKFVKSVKKCKIMAKQSCNIVKSKYFKYNKYIIIYTL